MTTDNPDLERSLLALYEKVMGKPAELNDLFTLDHCVRAIELEFDRQKDDTRQMLRVQKTETRIIQKLVESLLAADISNERADVIRDCLEKALEQCTRIIDQSPLKLGLYDSGDTSAQLIDVIISAVADPSLYDEFQGGRTLSEWQQDAMLAALNETGFDLVGEYDIYNEINLESLKAELNIANAMIEKLYQRVYEKMD